VDPSEWDLSAYDSLVLDVVASDGLRYTLVLKDEVPGRRPDGREESSVSWEYEFEIPQGSAGEVTMPLAEFRPTYRGREKKDAAPLDLRHVRRLSFMMRR
jgi:hypothetical protein